MDKEYASCKEIEALAALATASEISSRLRTIAGRHGKVNSVSRLRLPYLPELDKVIYLVEFARANDAMEASRELNCQLFGYTTLIVPIPADDATDEHR